MIERSEPRREPRTAIAEAELLGGLRAAVERVFESMLSTLGAGARLGDRCEIPEHGAGADAQDEGAITVEARVDIDGPLQGWITLSCTAHAAGDLARGLLRLGPGDVLSREQVEDALGECANLIAGVLKKECLDPRGNFAISVPRLSTRHPGALRPRGTLAHRVCSGTLNAELWLVRRLG